MFKIAETVERQSRSIRSFPVAEQAVRHQGLAQYCLSEEWTANLEEGIISLGQWSGIFHGLVASRPCGLLGLTRAYEASDRHHIVGLFEQAAAAPSSFCFSSLLRLADGKRQPVFCMAESTSSCQGRPLLLSGLFLFPRFKLEGSRTDLTSPYARIA